MPYTEGLDDGAQNIGETLAIARKHNLGYEVIMAMVHGCTPDEALKERDFFPFSPDDMTEGK